MDIDHSDRDAVNRSLIVPIASDRFTIGNGSHQVRAVSAGDASIPATRSYYTFPLQSATGVSGRVVRAKISFFHPSRSFDSPQSSETVSLFAVDCFTPQQLQKLKTPARGNPPREFTAAELNHLDAIFDDLGNGALYGEMTVTPAINGTWQEVVLNEDALCRINDALSRGAQAFSIGGDLTSPNTVAGLVPRGTQERIFRGSGGADSQPTRLQLVFDDSLPAPEACESTFECPATVAPVTHGPLAIFLLSFGLAAIGVFAGGRSYLSAAQPRLSR